MKHLALTIATALMLSQAIWHIQATDARQLRDAGEAALGLVRRMTYNDDRDGGSQTRNLSVLPRSAVVAEPRKRGSQLRLTNEAEIGGWSRAQPVVTSLLCMLGLPRLRATKPELRP